MSVPDADPTPEFDPSRREHEHPRPPLAGTRTAATAPGTPTELGAAVRTPVATGGVGGNDTTCLAFERSLVGRPRP